MIHFILAAVNVGVATMPFTDPNVACLNWAAAAFCFGMGILQAIENVGGN